MSTQGSSPQLDLMLMNNVKCLHQARHLTGSVVDGLCTCVAGRDGTCSHVAALLFYIFALAEKHVTEVLTDVTATGRQCTWSKALKRNVEPAEVASITFKKPEFAKPARPARNLK